MLSQARDILQKLVAFPTVSSESNLELIRYCQACLADAGVESHILTSDDGKKASLYATIGPAVAGGVVLSGHTDVVPVEGQVWESDPWVLTERDDKLYGRGAADMKGFIALALAAAPLFQHAGLSRPVHLAFSYDEEVGCLGGKLLVSELAGKIARPAAVIVGEPTRNQIANGHKSYTELLTTIHGHAVHSGRSDLGASAVTAAAQLVSWLDRLERHNALRSAPGERGFEPSYTSLHCGVFHGGINASTVADLANFTTDIRAVPWESASDYLHRYETYARDVVERRLISRHPGCRIDISVIADVPGLLPETDGVAEALALRLSDGASVRSVAYGTEAGLYQAAGWSTVVCGPGDILQAHKPDEFIELSQLSEAATMLQRLIDVLK